MALFITPETKRLTIPDSTDWVDIKTVLTVGMRNRIFSVAMKMKVSTSSDPEVDPLLFRTALLKEIIVNWSDISRPVTPAAVEDLDPEIADWIAEQFDSTQVVRDAEQIAFLGNGSSDGHAPTAPSNESQPGPKSSPTLMKSPGSESAT